MHVKQRVFLLSAIAAAALTGCGGGGDASDNLAREQSSAVKGSTGTGSIKPITPIDPLVAAAQPALSEQPLNTIVAKRILPQIDRFFDQLVTQRLDTEINGVKVFAANSGDKFLPGKVAIGMSYLLINTPTTDPKFATYLAGYRDIADFTIDTTNESWGIYYYTSALVKLKKAGLLEQAVSPATLEKLRTKLDFRTFVRPDYSLINLPTNYYGVAFSIARLRYLLGWETAEASEVLLQKMMNHYKTFSAFGFSDETDGSGRFDRYSILLIGEIMQRLIETGMEPSAEDTALLRGWLRQSVDVIKANLNPAGNGVSFGRSLAAYGDTAFTEVLSAAAHLNVLNAEEKDVAYAFATRIAAKYVEFWYDEDMQSLNMWEKGRRVDSYRGKARILGENLSLSHQLIYTANLWNADGYGTKAPIGTNQFVAYLNTQPRSTLTKFAGFDGAATTYDRGLITYRDGLRVINLPLVNGATTYHRTNPYFAVPHSYNMLSGVADTRWPQLQPHFTMSNNQALIPASYIKNVQTQETGTTLKVNYTQDAMDRTTGGEPVKDTRITSKTEYTFEPGQITRIDTYTPTGNQGVNKIELEFGSFSTGVTQVGNSFSFASGDVTGFTLEGLASCTASDVSANVDYNTPTGPLKTGIKCSSPASTLNAPLTIKWVLKYRSPSIASFRPQ